MWRGNSNAYFNSNNLTGNFYFNGAIPNIVRVGKVLPYDIHYSDFTDDDADHTTISNFTDLKVIWAKDFNLTISKGNSNDVVTVNRTSSPIGRSTGSVSAGSDTISYGDVLSASVTQRSNIAYVRNISPSSVTVTGNTTITTSNGAYKSGTISVSNANCPHITPSIVRTSSPYGASTGTISNGATIYWGDVIRIDKSYTVGYTGGAVSPNPRTFQPQNNGQVLSITMGSESQVSSYALTIIQGINTTITVNRISSPQGHASTGNLSNGATLYQGDVLTISRSYANANYSYTGGDLTVNSSSFTSGSSYVVIGANVTVETTAAYILYSYNVYNNTNYSVSTTSGYSISAKSSKSWQSTYSSETISCTYAESVSLSGAAGVSLSKTLQQSTHSITRTKNNARNHSQTYTITVNSNYCSSTSSYWYITSDPNLSASISNSNYYTTKLTLMARTSATVKHDNIRYLFFS